MLALLTLPLWAGSITKADLYGNYRIKDSNKETFLVTLSEDKLTLRMDDPIDNDGDGSIDGDWCLEANVLTVSYEMDSDPVEIAIDLSNTPMNKLERGVFIESTRRTFGDEKKVRLWMKKLKDSK